MENWLPVVGYEELYEVSDLGRVRTIKTGHIKKPTPNTKDGRPCLLLWKKNKYRLFKVSRLILLAFHGPRPQGYEGCHSDGIVTNNLASNLRWDTRSNNQRDRVKHGTSNRGERCGTAKLTELQVHYIIDDARLQREIAAEYGIRQSQVSRIKSGVRWGHLRSHS